MNYFGDTKLISSILKSEHLTFNLNSTNTKYNFPLLVAYVFVFFNTVFLPGGMYWTMLAFPLFFYNSIRYKLLTPYILFSIFSIIYFLIHLSLSIRYGDYLKSSVLTLLNIGFLINCYHYFNHEKEENLRKLFQKIIYLNFFLVILALVAFLIPVLKPFFWYLIPITKGSGIVPRLKLFTSEASVYSLLLSPLFLYYFFYYLKFKKLLNIHFFLFLIAPLALSFSFGVCAGILIAIAVTILVYDKQLLERRTINQLIFFSALFILVLFIWAYLDKDNLVVLRFKNIISGSDTSAKGRTFESFIIAKNVLNQYQSWLFGIGPGQFKIMGKELLLSYYQYSGNVADIRIPNACADTLIVYGILGLVIRITLELVLFVRTNVYKNHYRFALFVFLFVYQFTGSYYNNLIEWTIWVLVFSDTFKLFEKHLPTKQ